MYKFLKLVKESSIEDGSTRNVWVALISSEKDPQPFRVTVENFETEEEVMLVVNEWIAAREKEHEAAELEEKQLAEASRQEEVAAKLNDLS